MSDLADATVRHPCGCPCTCDVTWDEQLSADDLAWASAIRKASESEDDQVTVLVDDTADSMRDARADAYERGRAIESARAESRQALGLPLSRDGDVSLYENHDGDSVRYAVDGKEIARFPA